LIDKFILIKNEEFLFIFNLFKKVMRVHKYTSLLNLEICIHFEIIEINIVESKP